MSWTMSSFWANLHTRQEVTVLTLFPHKPYLVISRIPDAHLTDNLVFWLPFLVPIGSWPAWILCQTHARLPSTCHCLIMAVISSSRKLAFWHCPAYFPRCPSKSKAFSSERTGKAERQAGGSLRSASPPAQSGLVTRFCWFDISGPAQQFKNYCSFVIYLNVCQHLSSFIIL